MSEDKMAANCLEEELRIIKAFIDSQTDIEVLKHLAYCYAKWEHMAFTELHALRMSELHEYEKELDIS